MNSNQIYGVINAIAATTKPKEKLEIIKAHAAHPLFLIVLGSALDPTITYGIEQVPERTGDGSGVFNAVDADTVGRMLCDLANRKLTGNAARDVLSQALNSLSAESADLVSRILKKDLRAGIGASTVNKAIPGLIPEFPYMRCALPTEAKLDQFDWARGVFSQEKADGQFANVDHDSAGELRVTTRQGSEYPLCALERLAQAVRSHLWRGYRTHGELLVARAHVGILPREESNGILNSVQQGGAFAEGDRPIFFAWDQIPLTDARPNGRCETPYAERLANLQAQLADLGPGSVNLIDTRITHSLQDAYEHYREMLAKGKEGTIVKDATAVWFDGTSKQQVKLKLTAPCELKITEFLPGTGKNAATFGSVLVRSSCGQLEVAVAGFKDKQRAELYARREELVEAGIITVKANGIMEPKESGGLYSLFSPRFSELRTDKSEADDLPRIRAQFEAAILAA